jgi:hypothetical protein
MDLLSSIKASVQVTSPFHIDLVLRLEPELDVRETATLIQAHKADLPVLKAQLAPQPAVNRYTFTTLALGEEGATGGSGQTMPDEAGTHILVVIFVRH